MSNLNIPLVINSNGVFQTSVLSEVQILKRLEFFLLSGIKKHISLPTPGIETLWSILMNIGPSSKFSSSGVIEPTNKLRIEKKIKEEINEWLIGIADIEYVTLIGDEFTENGVKFSTNIYEYQFTFEFIIPRTRIKTPTIGNWYITGTINVRN